MTEQECLLRAILTDPDDDTVRLVYADWLQENGQEERGEFIRAEVEWARIKAEEEPDCWAVAQGEFTCFDPDCPWKVWDDARDQLRKRVEVLFNDIGYSLRDVHPWLRHTIHSNTYHTRTDNCCLYQRGFIDSLTCTSSDWLRHCDYLYWHPEQKKVCEGCRGGKGYWDDGGYKYQPAWWVDCPGCEGKGTVQRPLPITANPIRTVTLTTIPDFFGEMTFSEEKGWGHERWPGIKFNPPEIPERWRDVVDPAEIREGDMVALDSNGNMVRYRGQDGVTVIGRAFEGRAVTEEHYRRVRGDN